MPINTKYDGYDLALEKTTRVRDFGDGEFAVKAKGDIYLPVLSGQTKAEYDSYLMRGYVIPAVEPTAVAISGAIMRKDPTFNPDGSLEYLLEDFNGKGQSVNRFCEGMIKELLYSGCAGYLVEYTDKAVVKKYSKESIVNVSDDYIVLMQEYQQQDPKDKYKQTTKTEYLELTYDESGNYIQNIWRQSNSKEYVIVEIFTPTNRGQALDRIPFVFTGDLSEDPILLHLANVNHKQYMQSTDESHGLHWTALPTLFLFGDLKDRDGNDKQIKVGAGSANHIDDTDASAMLLEFTGAGLGALRNSIDDKKKTMASIGAKMLDAGGSGVKSAETSRIEASSETATMSVIANTVDSTMSELLEIIAEWMGAAVPEFEVNRDFIDTNLDPQSLLAYLQVYQSGGMSLNSFLSLLVKGELLPKGITAEDEAERVETTGIDFNEEVTPV
jgi:hypothetical protein